MVRGWQVQQQRATPAEDGKRHGIERAAGSWDTTQAKLVDKPSFCRLAACCPCGTGVPRGSTGGRCSCRTCGSGRPGWSTRGSGGSPAQQQRPM